MENLSEIIMWSLNGVFLLVILLAFVGGLFKGFYKSLTFLGFSILFFIAGIIAIPFITEMLLDTNLSVVNQFLPDEFHITTIRESLPLILIEQLPDYESLFVEGSETLALAFGLVKMVLNLVQFILLIILNATIFKLFPFITWLIVRPKKNPLTRRRPGKKRLLGGLIGAVKGFAALILMAIPLAGVSSLAESAKLALDSQPQPDNATMALVDDEIMDLIDAITSYRNSFFGFAFGVNVGDDVRLDERLFDSLLEIEVKTETSHEKFHVRKDVKSAAIIFSIVNEANEYREDFDDPLFVLNLSDKQIKEIQKEIKRISILNIAKNVGAEFGYDFIIDNELDVDYEDIVNLKSLKDIDIGDEINKVLDILAILNTSGVADKIKEEGLPETDEDIAELILELTKEDIQSVFDSLVELDLLKVGLPIGVNFALSMDDVKDMLAEIEFDEELIMKPDQDQLIGLVKGVGYLASVVLDASKDTVLIKDGELQIDPSIIMNLTDAHIDELQSIITDITILDLIKEMGVNYGYEILVDENLLEGYEDELSLENLQELLITQELNTILELLRLVNNSDLKDEVLENGFPETDEGLADLLSLIDKELVYDVADVIAELDTLKLGLPIGVNFGLRLEETIRILNDLEVDANSINKPTQQVLVDSVKNVIYLAGVVLDVNEGSIQFDEKIIGKFTEEDINDVQEIISNMEIIEVVKDIGAEVGYNFLLKEDLIEGYENILTLENIQQIMLTDEIVSILEIVKVLLDTELVDYIVLNGLPETDQDIEELLTALDKKTIQDIADLIVDLELVEYGLPVGVNFVLKMDEVDKIFSDLEVDKADINRPLQEVLVDGFKDILYLASIAFDVNDNSIKFDEKIIGKVEEADITEMQDIIADMELLEFFMDIGAHVGYNFLVKEDLIEGYDDLLTLENLQSILLRNELVSILDIVKLLVDTELLEDIAENGFPQKDEDLDALLVLVDKQMIQDIADALVGLELLEYGLPAGVNFAFKMDEVDKIFTDLEVDKADIDRPLQEVLVDGFKDILYLASIAFDVNDNSIKFDEKIIGKVEEDDITEMQDIIADMELLEFFMDIGAHVGYNFLVKEDLIEGYDDLLTLENLQSILLRNELVSILDIVKLLVDTELLEDIAENGFPQKDEDLDALLVLVDKQMIQDIADALVGLELLEYGLPAGVNFAFKMDEIDKIFTDLEVDKADIDRPLQEVLVDGFKDILYLASIAFDVNDNSIKFDEKIIGKVEEEDITEMQDIIADMELLEFFMDIGAHVGYNFLVKEDLIEGYDDLLTLENLQTILLRNELVTILDIVKLIIETDLVDEIVDNGMPKNQQGYEALAGKLTKQNIQDLADELVSLELLEYGLPAGLNFAFNMKELDKILTDFEVDKAALNKPLQEVLLDGFKDALYIFSIVFEANEGSFNFNEKLIGKITEEEITDVQDIVADMELLEFFKEVAAQAGHNFVIKQNLNEGYEDLLTLQNFLTIMLKDELYNILEAVKILKRTDVVDEIMNNGLPKNQQGYEALVGKLTKAEQQELIDSIVALETVYMGLPAGFNFALNLKDVKKLMVDYGIDQNTLVRPDQDELLGGLKGFGYIFTIVLEANEGSFNINQEVLKKFTKEQLTEIQVEIDDLMILETLKLIGTEFADGFLIKENLKEGYETELSLENLNAIQLRNELITLIDVLKIYIDLDTDEDVFKNPLALTAQEVEDAISLLGDLEMIQLGLLAGINYGLKMKEVKKIFTDANKDVADFVKPTKQEATEDFLNISALYTIIKDMNFNNIDEFNKINEERVLLIDDNDVVRLVHSLFDFALVYNNDELIAEIAHDFGNKNLPADFKDILKKDTLVNNFNADEFSKVALLGKLFFEQGLIKDGANIKVSEVLIDDNVEKISSYISESVILSEVTEDLIGILTNQLPGDLTIEIPVGFSFYGAAGKVELEALLLSVRNLDEFGLLEDNPDFGSLTHEQLDEISTNFSNSLIIRHNLSPMITQMTSTTNFSFITSDEDESFWTKDEIYYTLNAAKMFMAGNINADNIHTLPKEDVREISYSITVSHAMRDYLINENGPGGSLEDQLVIPEGLTYYSTKDPQVDGEVVYLFSGLQEILDGNSLSDFNLDVQSLLQSDIDGMFESRIIEATLVEKHLKTMTSDAHLGSYLVDEYEDGEQFDWYKNENPNNPDGDSLAFIHSVKKLEDHGISYSSMNFSAISTVLGDSPGCAQCINDALISSEILRASLPKMLDTMLNDEAELDVVVKPDYKKSDLDYWGEVGVNAELFDILNGMNAAETLAEFDFETLDNSNKAEFKANANLLAKSETLRQILPRVIDDSSLSMLDSLRSDKDANELTEQEWNTEIDILVDAIVLLNDNPDLDIDNPTIADGPVLLELKDIFEDSLLYDSDKINF